MPDNELVQHIKDKYGAVARSNLSSKHQGVRSVAEAFGYSAEELEALPAEANMGLSCGNPVATANLRPGEVVVDLGSGGGIDVLLAAGKVGPKGKAIGLDMTPEMVDRAQQNAVKFGKGTAPANVEFHLAQMEQMPLPDNSVDCLISNCVINLAPDKPAVFREMFRVLKPGGRIALSDIALKQTLPEELANDVLAHVGCIAGAVLISDYEKMLREAGFAEVKIVDTKKDLNAYAQAGSSGCCTPPESSESGSLVLEAEKTAAGSCCSPAVREKSSEATGCCSPEAEEKDKDSPCCTPTVTEKAAAIASCCSGSTTEKTETFHGDLADLLERYNANDYAASVQVYAIKK